jgi:hypothetical protein
MSSNFRINTFVNWLLPAVNQHCRSYAYATLKVMVRNQWRRQGFIMTFVIAILKCYLHIRLQKLRKITKGVRQNSTWPGWDSYRLCPKYKPKALLLHDPASWLVSYYLFVNFQVRSCAYLSQEEHNIHDHTLTRKWNHRKEHNPVSRHISPSSCLLIKQRIKFSRCQFQVRVKPSL